MENDKHTYRILGESGLAEDEEGNLYNADLSDLYSKQEHDTDDKLIGLWPPIGKTAPSLSDYDPRYCGPDPMAWLKEMNAKNE